MPEIPCGPHPDALIRIWRLLMRLSRRHGLFTLAKFHARLFPNGQFISLPASATMFVPPDPHFFGFVLGQHEPHITDLLIQYVQPGDLCVDVGANIGYFACILARLTGTQGEVWAYEPVPENFAALQMNAAIAGRSGLNLQCIDAAASHAAGQLRIVRREWSTYHEVAPYNPAINATAELVPAVALDDEIAKQPANRNVQIIKIDVEGHELPVINGLRKSLAAGRIRRLVVEITPGGESEEIASIFREHRCSTCYWTEGKWQTGNIARLPKRTDVFVECLKP